MWETQLTFHVHQGPKVAFVSLKLHTFSRGFSLWVGLCSLLWPEGAEGHCSELACRAVMTAAAAAAAHSKALESPLLQRQDPHIKEG